MTWIIEQREETRFEGDDGITILKFDVTWKDTDPVPYPNATDIVLNLKLHHGSTDADDISHISPRVLIKPDSNGSIGGSFDVYVKADRDVESDETFQVEITTEAWIEPGVAPDLVDVGVFGDGVIRNDDFPAKSIGQIPGQPGQPMQPKKPVKDPGNFYGDDYRRSDLDGDAYGRDDILEFGDGISRGAEEEPGFFALYGRQPLDPGRLQGAVSPFVTPVEPEDGVLVPVIHAGDFDLFGGLW